MNTAETTSWAQPNIDPSLSRPAVEIHHEQEDDSFLTQPYSTLDEPIRETIMRDVDSVVAKIKVVLMPLKKSVRMDNARMCRLYIHC